MISDWDPTILIVDDEPVNVHLLERLLGRAGYRHIVSTTNPREAETLFQRFKPDLVMLDLHMPRMDGHEVMVRLSRLTSSGEYLPTLMLTADVSSESKSRALVGGAKDFLTKPLDTSEVLARVANLLETRLLHLQLHRHNEFLEEKVKERTVELESMIRQLELAQGDLRLAQEETVTSLSLAAEFRDEQTSRHLERMSRYCSVIADALGLDSERRETIRLAAKMHDVGKIGIPDSILLKPGRLTPDEYEVMKGHAQIGYDILKGATSELATTAATIARTHHERFDGSGYPNGLSGHEIPPEGRIAAVADVFDALTSDRVYRKAFTTDHAFEMLRAGSGSHFDPEILTAFFDRSDEILNLRSALDEQNLAVRLESGADT